MAPSQQVPPTEMWPSWLYGHPCPPPAAVQRAAGSPAQGGLGPGEGRAHREPVPLPNCLHQSHLIEDLSLGSATFLFLDPPLSQSVFDLALVIN